MRHMIATKIEIPRININPTQFLHLEIKVSVPVVSARRKTSVKTVFEFREDLSNFTAYKQSR
jgi:hypothetical protein